MNEPGHFLAPLRLCGKTCRTYLPQRRKDAKEEFEEQNALSV